VKPSAPELGLQKLEIFADLEPAERAKLAAEFETLTLKRGDVLVRQGETADALFVVVSGRFAVMVAGRKAALSEIGAGQPVGEIAFFTGGERTATVTALRDSLVLKLSRAEFDQVSAKNPAIWRALTSTLARRLAASNSASAVPPDPRPRTIALIRAGSGTIPPQFIRLLVSVFTAESKVRLVGRREARDTLAAGTPFEGPEAIQALNALETTSDYVIFFTDNEPTPWSEKAIRQADLILLVGMHGSDPALNPLEKLAAEFVPADARRLVLLHPKHGLVKGTARWLAERKVNMHHHVALDGKGDVERLFRFINGTALGLVACGGGAFCAAHVGLYKALLEQGVTFDIMGGTSAGSAFTAAFALGRDPDSVDDWVHEIFVTNGAMRKYTLPRYSLLDHTHFDRQLSKHFTGIDIEDLWIPYFAVSTNLSSYELHKHRRGDIWHAVRASGSIPVVLPPFYTADGHMLVDGCLLDNVPIRTMHELKSGPNILVSFSVPDLERFDVDYSALPSRGDLFWRSVNPLRRHELPQAPGLTTVLMRSLMANRQDFRRSMGPDDLLLMPPCPVDMGILDWHRHTELVEMTYRWGMEEISRHKAEGHKALVG